MLTSQSSATYTQDERCNPVPDRTCWRPLQIDPPTPCVRLADISLAGMRLEWTDDHVSYQVKRATGGVETILTGTGSTIDTYWDDNFAYTPGTTYVYSVSGLGKPCPNVNESYNGLPPCQHNPGDTDCHPAIVTWWNSSPWGSITVTPEHLIASENQAVDSRADDRVEEYWPLDFQFESRVYKGGLFVGSASTPDQSGVGRSFVKFQPAQLAAGEKLWAANLNMYYMGSIANASSLEVGCQAVETDLWTATGANCLSWTSSLGLFPNFDSSKAKEIIIIGTGGVTQPNWCRWTSVFAPFAYEMRPSGDSIASFGFAQVNEPDYEHPVTVNNWAYFAKTQYDEDLGPRMVYAHGNAPIKVTDLSLSADSVRGGGYVIATARLNAPAPAGLNLIVYCDPCGAMARSGSGDVLITVPEGAMSVSFPVSTAVVSSSITVTVGARTYTCTPYINRTLTITP